MSAFTAVSIDDDLAPCKAGIAMRPANYKFTGWIDMLGDIVIE